MLNVKKNDTSWNANKNSFEVKSQTSFNFTSVFLSRIVTSNQFFFCSKICPQKFFRFFEHQVMFAESNELLYLSILSLKTIFSLNPQLGPTVTSNTICQHHRMQRLQHRICLLTTKNWNSLKWYFLFKRNISSETPLAMVPSTESSRKLGGKVSSKQNTFAN